MQQRMPPKTPAQSSLSYYTPSTQAPQTATVMLYIKLKQPLKNPGRFLASLGIICYIESVNIATMPLGIWYVTNMGLLAHATQHSAYSLTALPRLGCPETVASGQHLLNKQVLCGTRVSSDSCSPRKTSQQLLLLQLFVLNSLADKPPFTPKATDPIQ